MLTVTKFEHKDEEKTPQKKKNLHIKRKSPALNFEKTIYSFESFEAFCDFCTFLKDNLHENRISEFAKSSDLYEYNSNYYLILSNINVESPDLKYICSSITEFAHFINSSVLFERKIKEYDRLVINSSALTTCMQYFA